MVESLQKTPFDTYKELLDESFSKIAKTLPAKKYKELIDLCNVAADQLKNMPGDRD
jgi:hypothetical protein